MSALKQLFLDIKEKLLSIATFSYAVTRTGSGLNDFSYQGNYNGATANNHSAAFTLTISSAGVPDRFTWTGAGTSGAAQNITGTWQYLTAGIFIKFAATTGHTAGNTWTIAITGEGVIKFCQVWNSQTQREHDGNLYDYAKPAVFVEITDLEDIQQLGNGIQIYNDLTVRLHIVQEHYNATDPDSEQEQNLGIFDLTQKCFKALSKYQPTGCAPMVRIAERQQFDHDNVYEFEQDYRTNLVDNSLDEPVDAIIDSVNRSIDINTTFDPSPFTKDI